MSVRNLDEAIQMAFCAGPIVDVPKKVRDELKKFMKQELDQMEKELEDSKEFSTDELGTAVAAIRTYFFKIFTELPKGG